MSKNKRKKKFNMQVFIMTLIIVLLFGAFFSIIGTALFRRSYIRNYTLQAGINLTGRVTIYAEKNGEIYQLSEENKSHLAKTSVLGTLSFKQRKHKTTGDRIILTSVSNDDGTHRTIYLDELEDTKTLVTVINENGEKRVVLNDVRFSTFESYILEDRYEDGNIKVNEIP